MTETNKDELHLFPGVTNRKIERPWLLTALRADGAQSLPAGAPGDALVTATRGWAAGSVCPAELAAYPADAREKMLATTSADCTMLLGISFSWC